MEPDRCLADAELLAVLDGAEVDPSLRRHLDGCAECQGRLDELGRRLDELKAQPDQPLPSTLPARPPASPSSGPTAGHPARFGRYPVLEWLGHGGQGEVYRSEHPTLHVPLAIKWSHREFTQDAGLLEKEAEIVVNLDIEGVARVYDLGLHENRVYLVMKMVRGRTMQRYVLENALGPAPIAALMAQVARILGKAHERDVVHRDLKPENILVDGEGRPTIIDFGMAAFAQPWSENEPPSGGTLRFMAPEQARAMADFELGVPAERRPVVGPLSDVFGLGAVLYCLLTRRAPYPDDPDDPDSLRLLSRVRRGEYDRSPLFEAGVPRRLAKICLKAMAEEPAGRYLNASAMAGDLERFARPRDTRRFVGGAVAAVLLAVALLAAAFTLRDRAVAPPAGQLLVETIERERLLTPKSAEALADCLPLLPQDALRLACDVPRGAPVGLFCVDSQGTVSELEPLHVGRGGKYDRLVFPAEGNWRAAGAPGTLALLLIVGRRQKPQLDQIRGLFADAAGDSADPRAAWPKLEANTLLVLNHDKLEPFGEVPRGTDASAYSQVYDRLNALRERLGERFDHFWGVALPRDEPPSP